MLRKIGAIALSTALAGMALLTGAGPAVAGGNGQHVSISTRYSDLIMVCGNDQDNNYVCTDWLPSPTYWTTVNGWWWKGQLDINGWQNDATTNSGNWFAHCWVPVAQPGDMTWCDTAGQL